MRLIQNIKSPSNTSFFIVGLTSGGEKFRPSDWPERLCGLVSVFDDQKKMKYSRYVRPMHHNGEKVVFVDGQLYDSEPMVYRFLLNFAKDNELQLIEGNRIGPVPLKRIPIALAA
jgi:hypothetical protein